MKVVAIVSQKGGVGKTTLAVHLATAAAKAGHTVAIIDLDPQATAAQWGDWRAGDNPAVVAAPHARLAPTLAEAAKAGVALAVIDTGPAADSAAVAAAKNADLVLVPTRPAAFDLHSVKTTAELLRVTSTPAFAVLNAVPHFAGSVLEEAATVIQSLGLGLAPVPLVDRVAYRHAVTDGKVASEFDPGGKAAAEVDQLYEWTCRRVDLPARPLARRLNRKG